MQQSRGANKVQQTVSYCKGLIVFAAERIVRCAGSGLKLHLSISSVEATKNIGYDI